MWGHNYANITAPSHRKPDTLDKTVTFLAKRDGIDKVGVAVSTKRFSLRSVWCHYS